MLTVAVKDFGPIKEGTVELKPLTIFVGPSGFALKIGFDAKVLHLMQKSALHKKSTPKDRRSPGLGALKPAGWPRQWGRGT